MDRATKLAVKELHREVGALQIALAGKRPPHGERVADSRGYYVRTKFPSSFNRAERDLQRQFQRLIDLKRAISEAERTGRLPDHVFYFGAPAARPAVVELQTEGAC